MVGEPAGSTLSMLRDGWRRLRETFIVTTQSIPEIEITWEER